jgi:tryptophanyl-tRNA synthetase
MFGALESWRNMQEEYDCLFMIADWHALTSEYMNPSRILEDIREMLIDWLSLGIDPDRSIIFQQSSVPEHAELFSFLSCLTPIPWLTRNPTYKEQRKELGRTKLDTYGFLGYPVMQAADILIYKAKVVPVGMDQLPHLELAREIANRFNHLYGKTFPIPQPRLTDVPKVLGLDGRKMSKSYNNCIYISDPPEIVEKKVSSMYTDPSRARRGDPGNPHKCGVFFLQKGFSSEELTEIQEGCRSAKIGCVDCKRMLSALMVKALAPVREQRTKIMKKKDYIKDVLQEGSRRAREIAKLTLYEVKRALKIYYA